MTKEEEKFPKILFLYVGQVWGSKGTRLLSYLEVTKEQFELGELPGGYVFMHHIGARFYGAKIKNIRQSPLSGASPGQVFELEAGNGTIIPSSAQYMDMWPNEDHVTRWQATDRSLRAVLDREARKKKDARVDRMLERLEPLRQAYRNARGPQKPMLLAMIVERITR